MRFFLQWPIWEKLVFILACAIVVTVLAGCIKLGYAHWRLRKYSAIAERQRERREQAVQRQMSQRQRVADDVPFGIRAIESGIEVDGVWISRSNTPEPLSRDTSAGSSLWEHVAQPQHIADLEKQMLADAHERSVLNSIARSTRPTSSSVDCSVSAEKLPSHSASRDSSPEAPIAKPAKSHFPPCSYARFSSTPYIHYRSTSTMSTIEGLEAIHRASTDLNPDGSTSGSGSSNSSTDVEPISVSAPKLLTHQPMTRPRPRHKSSSELDLMNNHRISQAAETGQLTPRVRKTGQSMDWTILTRPAPACLQPKESVYARGDDLAGHQKLPPTPLESEPTSPTTNLASTKAEALPANIRRSSMPNVTPFAQFCQTAPISPNPEGRRSPSISGLQLTTHKRSASDNVSSYVLASRSPAEPVPIVAVPVSPSPTAQPQPRRPSFEKRESQVIRGHGSGFEIMKPGTFNPPVEGDDAAERRRAAPPVSLHNGYRSRSSSDDGRRRLQKRRRPSVSSEASSESGRRSRDSAP